MDENTTKEGIQWSSYLIPIATLILGSFLVPKIEWISNTLRIWIYTFALGLLVFGILTMPIAQQWLSEKIPIGRTWIMVAVTAASLIIWLVLGVVMTIQDVRHENTDQLRTDVEAVMKEITQFAANRELSHPLPTEQWSSPDEWFQKSVAYSKQSEYLYKSQYQQRLLTLGAGLRQRGYLSDEELEHFNWNVETVGYIRASDVLSTLAVCDSRLR